MRLYRSVTAAVIAIGVFLMAPAGAHEGHDHTQPPLTVTSASARGEAVSDNFEVVAVASGNSLEIYLDSFANNAPVEGATIEVETPAGNIRARAVPHGPYLLEIPGPSPTGQVDLVVTITAKGFTDILPLTLMIAPPKKGGSATPLSPSFASTHVTLGSAAVVALLVGAGAAWRLQRLWAVALLGVSLLGGAPVEAHDGHDHGTPAQSVVPTTGDLARPLPDGSLFVPKGAQRIFGLRTLTTKTESHQRSIELPGRVIPDPNASGFVQSIVGGRLSPPQGGFPRLGTPVKAGDILAYVTPPLQAIDVSDMRQKQGELDQQLAIVERRLKRNEQLAPVGAVARSELEDARTEVAGIKERRAMLDKVQRDPEALVAPVSGVIADGGAVAGQVAQPNAVVFHIIDPGKLWVEALSFAVIADSQGAFAKTSTGKTFKVTYRGSGLADRSQSLPVHFAVEGDLDGLRAGQFMTVSVTTGEEQMGIALPRSSLVRANNGLDVVFEHTSAETFVARLVRTAALDGDRILITAGLKEGVRVVTQGAELLGQVR